MGAGDTGAGHAWPRPSPARAAARPLSVRCTCDELPSSTRRGDRVQSEVARVQVEAKCAAPGPRSLLRSFLAGYWRLRLAGADPGQVRLQATPGPGGSRRVSDEPNPVQLFGPNSGLRENSNGMAGDISGLRRGAREMFDV